MVAMSLGSSWHWFLSVSGAHAWAPMLLPSPSAVPPVAEWLWSVWLPAGPESAGGFCFQKA